LDRRGYWGEVCAGRLTSRFKVEPAHGLTDLTT